MQHPQPTNSSDRQEPATRPTILLQLSATQLNQSRLLLPPLLTCDIGTVRTYDKYTAIIRRAANLSASTTYESLSTLSTGMSRKNITYAAKTTLSSRSAAIAARPAFSSLSSTEMGTVYNPYSLVDNRPGAMPQYKPYTSETRWGSGGSGKMSGLGMASVSEGAEMRSGDKNSGSYSQDDEDEDGDADRPPAVQHPAGMSASNKHHLAGPKKKRLFVEAALGDHVVDGLAASETCGAIDSPRKKISREIPIEKKMLVCEALETTDDDRALGDNHVLLEDDEGTADDEDDVYEVEEEMAIRRDFELKMGSDAAFQDTSADFFAAPSMEDLDSEIFESQWKDPHRFDDIADFVGLKYDAFLFDVNRDILPAAPGPTVCAESESASETTAILSQASVTDEDDPDNNVDLFFKPTESSLKRIVSIHKGGLSDETDDDAHYFFSSASSSPEETVNNTEIDTGFEEEDEDSEDDNEESEAPSPTSAMILLILQNSG